MKIREALPDIFDRPSLAIEPDTQTQLALSLLTFHEIDALPVGFSRHGHKKRVVSGYSCLSKLLETDPEEYAEYLDQPCGKVSLELATISVDKDVEALLEIFNAERFGFACVEDTAESGLRSFVSLRDLLVLYEKSIFRTDLAISDIASSPVFSLSGETNLKQVLVNLFEHEIRRVVVSETRKIVSDREIIDHVFATSRLSTVQMNPSTLLDAKLGDVESVQPQWISANESVAQAAIELSSNRAGCFICDKGLVTAWNMIIKPWSEDRLSVSGRHLQHYC